MRVIDTLISTFLCKLFKIDDIGMIGLLVTGVGVERDLQWELLVQNWPFTRLGRTSTLLLCKHI